jgi:hypothetical protein
MTQPWPETRDTLLLRLQNPADQQAWGEFVQLYQPLIVRFAVRQGLQDADKKGSQSNRTSGNEFVKQLDCRATEIKNS